MTRPKFFYDLEACQINSHYFLLKLVTSPGAYVKEFVHGDCGRTYPSISSLLSTQVSTCFDDCLFSITRLMILILFFLLSGAHSATRCYWDL